MSIANSGIEAQVLLRRPHDPFVKEKESSPLRRCAAHMLGRSGCLILLPVVGLLGAHYRVAAMREWGMARCEMRMWATCRFSNQTAEWKSLPVDFRRLSATNLVRSFMPERVRPPSGPFRG